MCYFAADFFGVLGDG
jgi:hypothetical protein